MPEPDPPAAIRTPLETTPASGGLPGEAPPFPVPDHTLIRRVGRGAYGEVWLARNTLGTWRAVKFIRRSSFDDDRPFERELTGIQRFEPVSRSHESQLNILHVGRAEDGFYYVMELADDMGRGQEIDEATYTPRNLRSELHLRGRLPAAECLRIGLALTTALEHLHRHDLVHRDIKPSNIVFVNGIPKLADIGLVARAEATISFVGTEGFLPPEGPGTRQADIYSLGKVLYELSTGHDRQQFPELPTNIVELPDRAELSELNEVLLKACHRDPKERYQSAAEMHADLALLESGRSVVRMRGLERRLKFVARAGAVVTGIAFLAGAAFFYQQIQTREARRLANENQALAETKTQFAADKTKLAEANREQLVRLRIANGVRLMDEGDLSTALLWFAQALPLVTNNPAEEAIHRIRIQQVLDRMPCLSQVWAESESIGVGVFSPDGKWAATASLGGRLRVWDVQSGATLWERQDLERGISQVRFTRDGQRLQVSSSRFQSHEAEAPLPSDFVAVLDAHTGKEVLLSTNVMEGWTFDAACRSVFSADDRWLAVAMTNHVIRLLDARDASFVAELKGHTNTIRILAFNSDGTLLASAGNDRTVRLWRVPSGEMLGEPLPHNLPLEEVAWSNDGKRLLTATRLHEQREECFIQTWDVATGSRIGSGIKAKKTVHTLGFTPGGSDRFILGLCGIQDRVELLNSETMQPALPALPKKGGEIWRYDFTRDGKRLAVGTDAGVAFAWNFETGEFLCPPLHHTAYLESVRFSPDGNQLLTTSEDGTAKLWTLREPSGVNNLRLEPEPTFYVHETWGRIPGPLLLHLVDGSVALVDPGHLKETYRLKPSQTNSPPYSCIVSPSGRAWAMFGGQDPQCGPQVMDIWHETTNGLSHLQLPHPAWVHSAVFSPDEERVISFCDGYFRIWKTSDGKLEQEIPIEKDRHVMQFLRDARGVLVRQEDGTIELRDIASQGVLSVVVPEPKLRGSTFEWRLEVNQQGNRLGAIGRQHGVVYDLMTGRPLSPAFKHGGRLISLDFSPDGSRLLTAGLSPEAKMWDCRTGELLLHPMRIDDTPSRIATWSPDGRFITTFNDANTARVWDAATAEAVTPLLRLETELYWAAVARGNRLITLSDPNLMRAWDLKPCSLSLDVIADYAKLMSGQRCSDSGVLLPLKGEEVVELHHSLRVRAPQLFR